MLTNPEADELVPLRRTFEALQHQQGSPERDRLNRDAVTSAYLTSKLYAVRLPFLMDDGTRHPQHHSTHCFRTARECVQKVAEWRRNHRGHLVAA